MSHNFLQLFNNSGIYIGAFLKSDKITQVTSSHVRLEDYKLATSSGCIMKSKNVVSKDRKTGNLGFCGILTILF